MEKELQVSAALGEMSELKKLADCDTFVISQGIQVGAPLVVLVSKRYLISSQECGIQKKRIVFLVAE